jgi:hypothetical protein
MVIVEKIPRKLNDWKNEIMPSIPGVLKNIAAGSYRPISRRQEKGGAGS